MFKLLTEGCGARPGVDARICEYDCVANAHRVLDGLADVLDT